ncbi:MAG: ATP-binding protein [Pseudomonadota bacterium]
MLNTFVLIILFIILETNTLSEHQKLRTNIQGLQRVSLLLDQYIIRLKFRQLENYDEIVQQQKKLQDYFVEINRLVRRNYTVNQKNSNDLYKKMHKFMQQARQSLDNSNRNIEHIKTTHSLLIISDLYFKQLAKNQITNFLAYNGGAKFANELLLLRERMASYTLFQTDQTLKAAKQNIKNLDAYLLQTTLSNILGKGRITQDLSDGLLETLRHSEIVFNKTKALNENIEHYFSIPKHSVYAQLMQSFEDIATSDSALYHNVIKLFYLMLVGSWLHIAYLLTQVLRQNRRISSQADDLRQSLVKQTELNQLQRKFVSMVSHEFRTPLAVIDSNAQKIIRRAEKIKPEKAVELSQKIRRAISKLLELIDSTLESQKIADGQFDFMPKYCNIKTIIEEICVTQNDLCHGKRVSWQLDALPDVVYADPILLSHIFSNLVSNALKYSPEGTKVNLMGHMDKNNIFIQVVDKGVGIPKEELSNIFTCFYRASTSIGIPGTGVGLHLVKSFIEQHNGQIEVASEIGLGSKFTVTLPCKREDEKENNISLKKAS